MEFELWRLLPLILMAPVQTAFVVIYVTRGLGAGDWWKEPVGRALFSSALSFAVMLNTICGVFLFNYFTGVYSGVLWAWASSPALGLIAVTYWAVFAAVCYQLWTLIKKRFTPR